MALQSQRQARFWTHDSATHTTACGATLGTKNFENSACSIYILYYIVVCVIVQGNSKLTILVRTGPIIQNMFERFLLLLFFIFAPCRDPCLRLPGLRCRVSEPKRCHVSSAACPQAVGNATSRHPSVLDAMFPEQGFGFGFPVVLGCVSFAWISAGRAVKRKFSACLEHHTSVGRCHVHIYEICRYQSEVLMAYQ